MYDFQVSKNKLKIQLDLPVCAEVNDTVAIFGRGAGTRWKLIASGHLQSCVSLECQSAYSDVLNTEEHAALCTDVDQEDEEEVKQREDLSDQSDDEEDVEAGEAKSDADEVEGDPVPVNNLDVWLANYKAGDNECRFYRHSYPGVGDLVVIKIEEVDQTVGAHCSLLEFNDIRGLLFVCS